MQFKNKFNVDLIFSPLKFCKSTFSNEWHPENIPCILVISQSLIGSLNDISLRSRISLNIFDKVILDFFFRNKYIF